jgi:hypothetical protein
MTDEEFESMLEELFEWMWDHDDGLIVLEVSLIAQVSDAPF